MEYQERKYTYGHTLTEAKIKRKCPYCNQIVNHDVITDISLKVTFDALLAFSLMKRGYEVVIWGGLLYGLHVFVFRVKKEDRDLPF